METYDDEYYDWWVQTNEQRFNEWVESMENYYENIELSGVPIMCLY